jgi:hypothetical protein
MKLLQSAADTTGISGIVGIGRAKIVNVFEHGFVSVAPTWSLFSPNKMSHYKKMLDDAAATHLTFVYYDRTSSIPLTRHRSSWNVENKHG